MNQGSISARQSERAFFVPSDAYHAVRLSGGKDSTAMLLLMIQHAALDERFRCEETTKCPDPREQEG